MEKASQNLSSEVVFHNHQLEISTVENVDSSEVDEQTYEQKCRLIEALYDECLTEKSEDYNEVEAEINRKVYGIDEDTDNPKYQTNHFDHIKRAGVITISNLSKEKAEKFYKTYSISLRRIRNSPEEVKELFGILRKQLSDGKFDTRPFLERLELPTQKNLEEKLIRKFEKMCSKKRLSSDASKLGWMYMDTNALKGVNDVLSHSLGNDFLEKIAEVHKDTNETKSDSGERIKFINGSHGTGDEFYAVVEGEGDLIESREKIVDYKEANLLDANCQEIFDITKLTDIEKASLKESIDIQAAKTNNEVSASQIDLNNPENALKLSAAVGFITIEEVLRDSNFRVTENDSFRTISGKLKKQLVLQAAKRADKVESKRKAGTNPFMRFLLSFRPEELKIK